MGVCGVVDLSDGSPEVNFNEYSRIALTSNGDRRLREKDPIVQHYGDYFHVGDNSTGISKSVIVNSNIAAYQQRYDPATVVALQEMESLVRENGDPDAIEAMDGFLAEARSDNPSRTRMRLLFNGVKQAIPVVAGTADAIAKVAQIFS